MAGPDWLRKLWAYRKTLWIVLPPLLLIPIPAVFPGTVSACGYTILLMAIYWVTEALPLAVTGFLPLIIFPLSGIMSADDVSASYFKDTTFLFVGGLMIAISVEVSGLHKRIALRVLLLVGPKPHCLMFGFMFTTFFLSMWISNTATTAMMLPIIEAVFLEIKSTSHRQNSNGDDGSDKVEKGEIESGFSKINPVFESSDLELKERKARNEEEEEQEVDEIGKESSSSPEREEEDREERKRAEKLERFVKGITISIPYSASIGGTVTLTGTGPNLVLSGQFETIFPDADVAVSFGNWIAYNAAGGCILLICAYIWLSVYFLGFSFGSLCICGSDYSESERNVKKIIKREYSKLGPIRWGETTVLIVFIFTALLWFFREPGFMPGYALLFPESDFPSDGTVAMTMAFLLFVLPAERPHFLRSTEEQEEEEESYGPVPAVLDWATVQRKFPWNIVFLIAGGFALAEGSTVSGFSEWVGEQLTFLGGIEPWGICLVVTIIVCVFTECSSNVATASLFVPILAELARKVRVHPLYLMMPPVLASSLAFMLPVATPPNAIAFSYGHLQVIDLVKAGWLMNILGVGVISLLVNTYGMQFWGLDQFPAWAEYPSANTTASP